MPTPQDQIEEFGETSLHINFAKSSAKASISKAAIERLGWSKGDGLNVVPNPYCNSLQIFRSNSGEEIVAKTTTLSYCDRKYEMWLSLKELAAIEWGNAQRLKNVVRFVDGKQCLELVNLDTRPVNMKYFFSRKYMEESAMSKKRRSRYFREFNKSQRNYYKERLPPEYFKALFEDHATGFDVDNLFHLSERIKEFRPLSRHVKEYAWLVKQYRFVKAVCRDRTPMKPGQGLDHVQAAEIRRIRKVNAEYIKYLHDKGRGKYSGFCTVDLSEYPMFPKRQEGKIESVPSTSFGPLPESI